MVGTLITSEPILGMGNPIFDDCMRVRTIVFVEEQGVPAENELDIDEPRCWHMACYSIDENNTRTPVGAIRIVTPPHPSHEEGPKKEPEGNYIKIGRLATVKEHRRRGVGKLLVDAAVKFSSENRHEVGCRNVNGEIIEGEWDGRILAHAQSAVSGAWARMGFVVDKDMGEWIEEGILHCGMWRKA